MHRTPLAIAVVIIWSFVGPAPITAQTATDSARSLSSVSAISEETFAAVWNPIASAFQSELARETTPQGRKLVYRRMLEQLVNDPKIAALRETETYRAGIRRLVAELPDSALAQSSNAPITNPATNQFIERSGATQLIALAGDFRQLFSADENAVSLNLNAIALVGGGKEKGRSAQFYYSSREDWKRITGTVTFGAKIPEKQVTGLSGLPSADDLFDAISWDAKVRIVGDRDPLATRWYPLLLGQMGDKVDLVTRVVGLPVDPADVGILKEAANELVGTSLAEAKDRIASSLQLSVKGFGVHLRDVEGKNKYGFATMLDKGFKELDLTANASYNVADALQPGATDPFTSKDVQLAAGLTGSVLKGRIVEGRAVELAASFQGRIFVDGGDVPIDRKNTFNINTTLSIPFQLKGKIPISLTWTNDPNNLKKEKYVSGQIGFTYDFAAIWEVLKAPGR